MTPIAAVAVVVLTGQCTLCCTVLRNPVRTTRARSRSYVGTSKAVEVEARHRLGSRLRHHRQCMRTRGKGMAAHLVGAVGSDAGSTTLKR